VEGRTRGQDGEGNERERERETGETRAKLQDTRSVLLAAHYVSFMTDGGKEQRERGGERERERDNNSSCSRSIKNKSVAR